MRWSNSRRNVGSMLRNDMDRGMIPLINIVFLMLAFLVLAGQIEVHQRKLAVPKSTSEIERTEMHQTLTVFADGSLEWEGAEIQIAALPQILERAGLTGNDETRATVLVVADAQLLVSDLQNVMNALQELGIQTVNLATLPDPGNAS